MSNLQYLTPDSYSWEPTWAELAARVGSLDGWEYMGPNNAYSSHVFRLRAMPGRRQRVELVRIF